MQEINFDDKGNTPRTDPISGNWGVKGETREGPIARAIERRTTKIASDVFLWAALGAMAGSAVLQVLGRKHESLFVGQWPPAILMMGLYNKIAKVTGSR
jgi:hypothetical protein